MTPEQQAAYDAFKVAEDAAIEAAKAFFATVPSESFDDAMAQHVECSGDMSYKDLREEFCDDIYQQAVTVANFLDDADEELENN
jgi:regulator of RNase E activity RraB